MCVFTHPQTVTILTCYIKISVGYFELKLQKYKLRPSRSYYGNQEANQELSRFNLLKLLTKQLVFM